MGYLEFMQLRLLLFFILCLAKFSFAQNDKSTYREKFSQGDLLILEENYELALKYFKEAYLIDSSNANIN